MHSARIQSAPNTQFLSLPAILGWLLSLYHVGFGPRCTIHSLLLEPHRRQGTPHCNTQFDQRPSSRSDVVCPCRAIRQQFFYRSASVAEAQSGVSSKIIGASTLQQLDKNLKALDLSA
jgi:hypothetical protein